MPNLSAKELEELRRDLKEYEVYHSDIAQACGCTERYVRAVLSSKDSRTNSKVIRVAKAKLAEALNKEFSKAAKKYSAKLAVL